MLSLFIYHILVASGHKAYHMAYNFFLFLTELQGRID